MLTKEYLYINHRRHQVSIESELIEQIRAIGYSLDSFLQDDLEQIESADFSSKKIKELVLNKLEQMHQSLEKQKEEEMSKKDFTFVDLFAGIGGFRLALENQGGKCLAYSEIQWDSLRVYAQNFSMNELFLGDIKAVSQIDVGQAIDLIVGGVPCQSWSSAGKNRGFDDDRGRLWLETIRIVKENQPKCFLFENVKGLTDPRHSKALKFILKAFEDIGYFVKYKVLSSKDFGLVQARERVFLVGFRDQALLDRFSWPQTTSQDISLGEVIKLDQYQKNQRQADTPIGIDSSASVGKQKSFNDYFIFSDVRTGETTLHSWDFMHITELERCVCLNFISLRRSLGKQLYGRDGAPLSFKDIQAAMKAKDLFDFSLDTLEDLVQKGIFKRFDGIDEDGKREIRYDFVNSKQSTGIDDMYRIYSPDSVSFSTLTATGSPDYIALKPFLGKTSKEYCQYFIDHIYKKKQFRSLTDREFARLQGFPDHFILCKQGNAKRQLGNAVSVPVIEQLVLAIKNTNVFNT